MGRQATKGEVANLAYGDSGLDNMIFAKDTIFSLLNNFCALSCQPCGMLSIVATYVSIIREMKTKKGKK